MNWRYIGNGIVMKSPDGITMGKAATSCTSQTWMGMAWMRSYSDRVQLTTMGKDCGPPGLATAITRTWGKSIPNDQASKFISESKALFRALNPRGSAKWMRRRERFFGL